jgi:choline dehydrogenase-like flavoprotein
MKNAKNASPAQARKKTQPEEFDLVILGGGTGSTIAAWTFAGEGKQVAVIDRKYIGGSCGFVFRDYEPTIPASVTYGITKRMKDISKVMGDLDELARKWQQENAHVRTKLEGGKVRARHAEVREAAHA